MAAVFFPDQDRLTRLGYGRVAHVPVVFDRRHRYCRDVNRYMRARATLEWHPSADGMAAGRDYPRAASLRAMAYELSNFDGYHPRRLVPALGRRQARSGIPMV